MKKLMKRSVCLLMSLLTLHASFPLEASNNTDEGTRTDHLGETIQPSPRKETYVTVHDLKSFLQESQARQERTEARLMDLLQRTLRQAGEGEVGINSSTPLMGTNERQGQVRASQPGSSQDTNPRQFNGAPSSPDQVEIEINDENGEEADDESESTPIDLNEDIKGTKMDNCFKFGMNFWLIAGIIFDVTGIGAVALTAIFTSLSTAVEFFSDQTIHILRFAALVTSLSSTVSIMLKHIAKKTSNDRRKELTNMHREHRRVTRHNRDRQPFEKLQRTAKKVFRGQDRRASL